MSDPATCPDCKGAMKPLFTGFYCPNDCDKPHLKAARLANTIAKAQDIMTKPRIFMKPVAPAIHNIGAWIPYSGGPPVPQYAPMANDECRDFFCNGKGKVTHTSVYTGINTAHYACDICAKTWGIIV